MVSASHCPQKGFCESLDYKIIEEKSRDVGEGQRLDFWKAVKALLVMIAEILKAEPFEVV